MTKIENMKLTHAGGVVFQKKESQTLYLVISSSDGANWVLPKGHIEQGETPQDTALRELQEETGIIGEIVSELSTQYFKRLDEIIHVQYFLISKLSHSEAKENRSIKWVNQQTALQLLSFEDARNVLKDAAKVLSKL